MSASIGFGDLFSMVAVVAALVGGAWALVKVVVAQFEKRLDERFAIQERAREEGRREWDGRLRRNEDVAHKTDRALLELKAELPVNYVRREDHIRFETVIDAKLAALNSKLDLISERQLKEQQQRRDT